MTSTGLVLFLLSTAVKASLILAVAFFVTRLLRERPAAERHLVWMLASICVLALPLLALSMPAWRFAVHSDVLARLGVESGHDVVMVRPRLEAARVRPVEVIVVPGGAAVAAPGALLVRPTRARFRSDEAHAAPIPPVTPHVPEVPDVPGEPTRSSTWLLGAVLMTWLAGSLVVGARLLTSLLRVRRIARSARPLLDPVLLVRAHGIAAQMNLPRAVRYLEGADDEMPMTFGILRPTLLLPSSARRWSSARQNAVLRHELAHIRRRDSLSQLLAELGCALHWFNPLMWWAARSMCVEREHACDDAVLAAGSRPSDYAAELLDIARTLRAQRTTALAAIALARPSDLRSRLTALLDPRPRRERTATTLLVPAWLGALALVTPLSSLAPEISPRVQTTVQSPAAHAAVAPAAPEPDLAWGATPLVRVRAGDAAEALAPITVAQATAICGGGRIRNINSNSNDDRRTIKWSGDDCSGEVVIEGDVRFDPTFTRIAGLSGDGEVRITTEEGRTERRVLIRPSGNGVSHEYRVNGDRRELDAEGQAWLDDTILFLFRRLGFMAEERATSILERGGVNAVLAETDQLSGDYARAAYLEVLVERGSLDAGSLRRVLDIAGRTIDSDHYRTQIITGVAGNYAMDTAMRDTYISAVSGIDSDHYRHVAFSTLLEKGRLTPAQVSAVLRETGQIGSDHYRATLLEELAARYRDAPDIREAYLDAAADISSDHYKTVVLARLLEGDGLSAAEQARVIGAAESISSDHYRSEILRSVADDLRDAATLNAFVRAARGIRSDHYLQGVLQQAVANENVDRTALLGILQAAGSIRSDHYRSELLVEIARQHRLDGEVRTAFERLMNGISSRHYRGSVAEALVRNGR